MWLLLKSRPTNQKRVCLPATAMRPIRWRGCSGATGGTRCGLEIQLIGTNARAKTLRAGQDAGSGNQVDVGQLATLLPHRVRIERPSSVTVCVR